MKIFIQNIKKIMAEKDLNIEQIAALCKLDVITFQSFLSETKCPKPSELVNIAANLKISFEKLLLNSCNIPEKFNCKLLALDIDGVMTDGGMYVTSDQKEFKKFNTHDGIAIRGVLKNNIEVRIISNGLMHDLIKYRAEMIGVKNFYVGNEKKLPILEKWCSEMNISLQQVAYIGDDINDLEVIRKVGLSACPANAMPTVKAEVNIILNKNGGEGCVREFVEIMNLM